MKFKIMSNSRSFKTPWISRIRSYILKAVLISGFSLYCTANIFAQGNLLITPRRVVFDGSKRSIDLNLANTGKDSATYAISLVQIRMTKEGSFETITEPDPGQLFADDYIRFFPRSVTLSPNEAQVVKVQVTRRGQLEKGEYRSHFYFRAVPVAKPLGEQSDANVDNNISIKLTPVFGITIPVIIRVGKPSTFIVLTDLTLEKVNGPEPRLSLNFIRSGTMSIYGDLAVDHISPSGVETRVAIARGVAVYTPNIIRKFSINLSKSEVADYTSGKLKVHYSAPSDVDPEIFAESELILK